jgi:hypothetical protein
MANKYTPFGARVINTVIAADFNSKTHSYYTSSTDATQMFVGDFVKLTGESTDSGIPYVTSSDYGDNSLVGIVVGIRNAYTKEYQLFRDENDVLEIEIMDDPLIEFEMQVNGIFTTSDIGKKADIEYDSGSIFTGLSGNQINASSIGSGSQLLIIGVLPRSDNEIGLYTKVRVLLQCHAYLNKAVTSVTWPRTGVFYVDNLRSDSYTANGSIMYPYKTIQGAIDAAGLVSLTFATILIFPSTYVENLVLENNFLNKVQLVGLYSDSTIIHPVSGNAIQSSASNSNLILLNLSNLTITGPIVLSGSSSFLTTGFELNSSKITGNIACTATSGVFRSEDSDITGNITCNATNGSLVFNESSLTGSLTTTNYAVHTKEHNFVNGSIDIHGAKDAELADGRFEGTGTLTVYDSIQLVMRNNYVGYAVNVGTMNDNLVAAQCYNNQFASTVTVNATGSFYNNEFYGSLGALDVENTYSAYGTATCNSDNFTTSITIGSSGILNLNSCRTSSTIIIGAGGVLNTTEDRSSCNDGYVAHAGGGQANAQLIVEKFVVISTVASLSDSCKLPHAKKGDWMIVRNSGVNNCDIYPPVGEYMLGVLNISTSLASGSTGIFYCKQESHWMAALIS